MKSCRASSLRSWIARCSRRSGGRSLAQWSHRTLVRNKSDHLLTGLLFDDAGHRMIPNPRRESQHHYRYYTSTSVLHGEAKTASAGVLSRVPAADIEEIVVKYLKDPCEPKQVSNWTLTLRERDTLRSLSPGLSLHKDRLIVRLKSDQTDEASKLPDDRSLTIPWEKPPTRRSRGSCYRTTRSRARRPSQQFERRARLVGAIARSSVAG